MKTCLDLRFFFTFVCESIDDIQIRIISFIYLWSEHKYIRHIHWVFAYVCSQLHDAFQHLLYDLPFVACALHGWTHCFRVLYFLFIRCLDMVGPLAQAINDPFFAYAERQMYQIGIKMLRLSCLVLETHFFLSLSPSDFFIIMSYGASKCRTVRNNVISKRMN